MLTVIQHHAVQVDFVVDAAQLMASSIEDEKIDGHDDVVEGASCDRPPGCGIEMVDNDGEVEVAVGAEVAAGAGAEGDDLEGLAAATMRSIAARIFSSVTRMSSWVGAVAMLEVYTWGRARRGREASRQPISAGGD
jgi:hypothetical protein